MPKIFAICLCLLGLISCRESAEDTLPPKVELATFPTDSIPSIVPVNSLTEQLILDWPEYNDLQNAFQQVYRIGNREDLALTINDLIERQKSLETSEYPEEFDSPKVKSRQKVLKTYILKVKAAIIYREDLVAPVAQMMEAYNAMRMEFDVIVNNTLEKDLILDE